jgi:hypothetical protein
MARRIWSIVAAGAVASVVLALALLAGGRWGQVEALFPLIPGRVVSGSVLLGLTIVVLVLAQRRHWSYPGIGRPRSWSFLLLFPAAGAAGLAGAAWIPVEPALAGAPAIVDGWRLPTSTVVGIVGFELLFRGLCQGMMITTHPAMSWSGRRFLSIPNVGAASLSTGAVLLALLPPSWVDGGAASFGLWAAAVLVMGLSCGAARERSGSVWAAVILHLSAAIVAWAAAPILL